MLIYAPSPDAEYASIFGNLTDEHKELFESRLRAEAPAVRFLMELEKSGHPAVRRFTLKLHREDRERAMPGVHEVAERISPRQTRIEREDRDVAALVRQFARAHGAGDGIAAEVMRGYLCRHIQYLLERLLLYAKLEWAVDLSLDGISAQELTWAPPFGLDIRGYIYVRRGSDGSETREPFEAELRASQASPALERFDVRFGDRSRLAAEGVIRADLVENYPLADTAFSVRIGGSVARRPGQLVEWAFEFAKSRRTVDEA